MACPKTKDFTAWINLRPGSEKKLIVTGLVQTNAGNIRPRLYETVPQGFSPQILALDLTIVDTGGIGSQDINYREVRFEITASQGQYDNININFEKKKCLNLKVTEVH